MRTLCWFSAGAASAVATKLSLTESCEIIYCDTGAEHPDNRRFIADCEKWFGREIQIERSDKYIDIWDVFEKTRYLSGVNGARCTIELKKKVRERIQNPYNDIQIFGYTYEEINRARRFDKNNPEANAKYPLIENKITKSDCIDIISKAGIKIPEMYMQGYSHNNCIGCVKGQSGYWNKIRIDYPEIFERMAGVERELDAAINKRYEGKKRIRVFLDELDSAAGNYDNEPPIQCGLLCDVLEID